jgi:hypothetical protein
MTTASAAQSMNMPISVVLKEKRDLKMAGTAAQNFMDGF